MPFHTRICLSFILTSGKKIQFDLTFVILMTNDNEALIKNFLIFTVVFNFVSDLTDTCVIPSWPVNSASLTTRLLSAPSTQDNPASAADDEEENLPTYSACDGAPGLLGAPSSSSENIQPSITNTVSREIKPAFGLNDSSPHRTTAASPSSGSLLEDTAVYEEMVSYPVMQFQGYKSVLNSDISPTTPPAASPDTLRNEASSSSHPGNFGREVQREELDDITQQKDTAGTGQENRAGSRSPVPILNMEENNGEGAPQGNLAVHEIEDAAQDSLLVAESADLPTIDLGELPNLNIENME